MLSADSRAPWVHRVLSVHSRPPWGSLASFCCVRSIPVRFGRHLVRWRAFGPFPCALGVVGFVRVRSVHSRAQWGSSGSFVCVRSINVRTSVRSGTIPVRDLDSSGVFGPVPRVLGSVGCVPRIHVRRWDRRFRSGTIRVRRRVGSVHSRAPWGSSGLF